MEIVVSKLEPAGLWKHFEKILAIPRCSGSEGPAGDYVAGVAREHGLEYDRDEAGNIVVRKHASQGRESSPMAILQGHLDMVCEKNSNVMHDFSRDPIQVQRDGDWLQAKGTTLGADNAIGVAAALAVMEDRSLVHGPLEFLFTVDEERGLTGASKIRPDFLRGRILMNLDSEEEGAFFIGCAGGGDSIMTLPLKMGKAVEGAKLQIALQGLRGGHSGIDINQGRGNAIKLLARMLWQAGAVQKYHLVKFEGGSKRNAIAREASAEVIVTPRYVKRLSKALQDSFRNIQAEYAAVEKEMDLKITEFGIAKTDSPSRASQEKMLNLIFSLPHGVLAMSQEIPGLVETSNNVATVEWRLPEVKIGLSSRSSILSALRATRDMVKACAAVAGARIEQPAGYPSWTPNLRSPVLKTMQEVHRDLFGKDAAVMAIHAGLECGLIGEKFSGMDMISFGPDLEHPHSPDERVRIPSVQNFWRLLIAALERLARQ